MTPEPPRAFARMLARAVRDDPAGAAILGDLHEDFVGIVRERGEAAARRWYRREVGLLVTSRVARAGFTFFFGRGLMNGIFQRGLGHDLSSAMRSVRRAPGLFVLLALVIGLGVGATTAVYSVLSPLLLAPLPFGDPGALVWIENTAGGTSRSEVTSRSSNLRDFRALTRTFDGITGYNAFFDQSTYTLTLDGQSDQLMAAGVAADFLEVLGVEPLVGRSFTPEEGSWGGPRAIILTHGFWSRRFASDPGIVGTAVPINGVAAEVVGVLPASFDFTTLFSPGVRVDFLVPFPVSDETDRWGNTMSFIGRLRPGVSVVAAQQDLDGVLRALEEEQPERWGLGARVTPLQSHIAGPFRSALMLLAAAAAAVMLIVCVNVANVLLARSPRRGREMAVRKALGATRGRIVRQLMIESMLLSCAGGVVGIGLAVFVTRFISSLTGIAIPLLDRVSVDAPALAFAVVAATVAGLLAGLAPALQVADGHESDTLRAAARGTSGDRAGRRLRESLVVAELAIACVLLVAGGLLLRSFQAVLDVDLAFRSADAVGWQLHPSRTFDSNAERAAFHAQVTDRIRALRGVESVGLVDALPLGRNRTWGIVVAGEIADDPTDRLTLFPHLVDPGYRATMEIPLIAGRDFTPFDRSDSPPVVMINETAARSLFPGEDPLGRQVRSGGRDFAWEVVGVVADVHHLTPEQEPGLEVYFPISQLGDYSTLDLVVRSRLPTATLAAAVSGALAELDPAMPTRDFWTLSSTLDRSLSPRRFTLQVLGAFGIVALLLAALGIYGVLSQSVAERTREIGIRMSLGASAGSVRRFVVTRTLLLAAAGIGIGVLAALPGTRLLSSMLYDVPSTDPVTLLSMASVLLAVAGLSGLVPAIRASRTNALGVLRGE